MQMNGINELITVAKYWKRWRDPRIIFLVLNNRDLNQVSWEMRIESGDPKFDASQDLPDFPYARYAELLGFYGDPGRQARAGRRSLGCGAVRRSAGRVRGLYGSQRVDPASPHQLRASKELHVGDGQGRPGRKGSHRRVGQEHDGRDLPRQGRQSLGRPPVLPRSCVPVKRVAVSAYRIPTDVPNESDGTLVWTATTLVLVEAEAGGVTGLGYTYADAATARLIHDTLADVVRGEDAMANGRIWAALVAQIRNPGRPGISAMAIAAIDVALWDLKARLLGLPLVTLLGPTRDAVPVYGSGGFTLYSIDQLERQLARWVQMGIPRVKMKIGREPTRDIQRIAAARAAIGDDAELFVDANGAYGRKQAVAQAERFVESRVGLVRGARVPPGPGRTPTLSRARSGPMEISVGEYGYEPSDFARILDARAVDVLQADASRCEGITGFLVTDSLCEAMMMPLSAHCAPSLHAHVGCAAKRLRHIEYFHDHVRVEHLLFDGVLTPVDGALRPDLARPGLGLDFKHSDAAKYALWTSRITLPLRRLAHRAPAR